MSALREVCHCGHHKDTHHDGGAGDCLGIGCNVGEKVKDCPFYRDDSKPDPLRAKPKNPNHESRWNSRYGWVACQCYECKRYRAAL